MTIDTLSLEKYYEILRTKFLLSQELRKHYGKILSPEFNSFDFWWLDENKVSDILAFFLNPEETHAQGYVFLKIFLQSIGIDIDCEQFLIEVKREHSTNENRRIDIVISFNKGEFIIGIENKIYETTADQPRQIEHYCENLKSKSNNNYCLIYLSPNKKLISEDSLPNYQRELLENDKRFKKISYEEHVINCIHSFSLNSESERVRSFLIDFENKVKEMYIGEKFMDEHSILIDFATSNPQNLETTLRIGTIIGELKLLLKNKFYCQCEEIAKECSCLIDKEPYDSPTFYPMTWKNHGICFIFSAGNLIYVIRRKRWDPEKTRRLDVETKIGGTWNVTNWFVCEYPLYRNVETNPEMWLIIENGDMKGIVLKIVKDFIETLTSFDL
jgi:hypothetical protein